MLSPVTAVFVLGSVTDERADVVPGVVEDIGPIGSSALIDGGVALLAARSCESRGGAASNAA